MVPCVCARVHASEGWVYLHGTVCVSVSVFVCCVCHTSALYTLPCRSELIWQLRQRDSTKWKTVDEGLRGKLETAYKEDPKAVLKEDELHVRL